jgi:hypothetical protein
LTEFSVVRASATGHMGNSFHALFLIGVTRRFVQNCTL